MLVSALVTGCSGPVKVPAADPTEASTRDICRALIQGLPDRVLDQSRRETTEPQLTGAWGSPPITIACGIAQPEAMRRDSGCFEVNGVGWFAEEGSGGWLFTTIGREAYVQLGVPAKYAPEANALIDVADAVRTHDPMLKPCV